MPKITVYNDSDSDLDADFDVIEIMSGKEVKRTTQEPCEGQNPEQYRLFASNQAFLIVPRGTTCPKIAGMARGRQIDAKPRDNQ
jgi:hypothetical protein